MNHKTEQHLCLAAAGEGLRAADPGDPPGLQPCSLLNSGFQRLTPNCWLCVTVTTEGAVSCG